MTNQILNNLRGNYTDSPCWYCSIRNDSGKFALVLGPFATEKACREWAYYADSGSPERDVSGGSHKHSLLVKAAEKRDSRSWFYAWGMAKAPNGYREGVLNADLPEAERDMRLGVEVAA